MSSINEKSIQNGSFGPPVKCTIEESFASNVEAADFIVNFEKVDVQM